MVEPVSTGALTIPEALVIAGGTGIIGFVGAMVREWFSHRKHPETQADKNSTFKTSIEAMGEMIEDLQSERRENRLAMRLAQEEVIAAMNRMNAAIERCAILERNNYRRELYITKCQALLKQASIEPPELPIFEPEPA